MNLKETLKLEAINRTKYRCWSAQANKQYGGSTVTDELETIDHTGVMLNGKKFFVSGGCNQDLQIKLIKALITRLS